jgi:hydroxymethylpyrimidine kinase/phosphomethylpyrimidine kinase
MLTVMTIAGFDPSGGAGVLADIKTIRAIGCFGVAAITSLTMQNTQGVFGAYHQTREVVRGQLEPLFDDFDIAAIKTGMLPTREVIEEVAEAISAHSIKHVVVDPVVRSTSGFDLINDRALASLIDLLFPLASLVTPNRAEAERITGCEIGDRSQIEQAARKIFSLGPGAVLITGGDVKDEKATDLFIDSGGAVAYSSERVDSTNTHGTGCTLSSALACLLASGHALRSGLPIAKQYIVEAITNAPGLGRGHGPLNHSSRKSFT